MSATTDTTDWQAIAEQHARQRDVAIAQRDALALQLEAKTTTPATFWHATLETRNFSFSAHGRNTHEATAAMQALLVEHAKENGLPVAWAKTQQVQLERVAFGAGYRDGELVLVAAC